MTDNVTGQRIKAYIERIERLEAEKQALADDIKEIYSEAKGSGFDAPTIKKIVALRKKDPEKRTEEEELLSLYLASIGM